MLESYVSQQEAQVIFVDSADDGTQLSNSFLYKMLISIPPLSDLRELGVESWTPYVHTLSPLSSAYSFLSSLESWSSRVWHSVSDQCNGTSNGTSQLLEDMTWRSGGQCCQVWTWMSR